MPYDEYADDGALGLSQVAPQPSSPTLDLPQVGGAPNYSRDIHDEAGIPAQQGPGFMDSLKGLFSGADAAATRKQNFRNEYLGSLSMPEKIALALQEGGASLTHKPSPLDARLQAAREERAYKLQELHSGVDAVVKGAALARMQPEGEQRTAFVKLYSDAMPENLRGAFLHMTTGPDADLLHGLTSDPRIINYVKRASLADPKYAEKVLENPKLLDPLVAKFDQQDLPSIHKKLDVITQSPEFAKFMSGNKTPSFADIFRANAEIQGPGKLSEFEMATLNRHQKDVLPAYGILTKDALEEVLKDRKKKEGAEPKTEVIDGKKYQYDPERKNSGTRLATDQNYVLLGSAKDPNEKMKLDRDTELKLSDDYRQDVKGFKEAKSKFTAAAQYVAAAEKDAKKITPAGDRALVFAFAKMLDPGDKVAVKDVQDIDKLSGVPSRITQAVKNLATGKDLPNEVRREMMDVMRREFGTLNRQQQQTESEHTEKAKRYGLEPKNIVVPYALPLNPEDFGGRPAKPK